MDVKFRLMVLKRALGPAMQVIGRWRKLHYEKLHNIYAPPSNIWTKEEDMGETRGTHAKDEKCMHSLYRKTMKSKIIHKT
jgi:hypothetical protein